MEIKYLVKNPYGGIIFYGKDGTGVVSDAIHAAEEVANYGAESQKAFDEHPDCYFIDLIPGKKRDNTGTDRGYQKTPECYPCVFEG